MKALRYHELAKQVETASQSTSSVYLERGDDGLTEDLVQGYVENFRRGHEWGITTVTTPDALQAEIQYVPPDGRYWCVLVRDAHKVFTAKHREALLMQLEHQKRNARLRVICVGDAPSDEVRDWFMEKRAYGEVNEPSFEKMGAWMATKTAGRWDYRSTIGALITEATGLRLMEHVGWDYTAALQAAKTIRAFTDSQLSWDAVSALVPAKAGDGYADALVFGKGRKGLYSLSQGIVGAEVPRTLGLIRFYLRQFAKLRAIEVEHMGDRAVEAESGIHIWHWRTRYKPVYPSYTNERIRRRLAAVEFALQAVRHGAEIGVLEVLVAEW